MANHNPKHPQSASNSPQAPKRAAIYARVSDPQQVTNYSLETQFAACRAYAEKIGCTTIEEFPEKGETGTVFDRTCFNELRRIISQFDVLIVYRQDRLGRADELDTWNLIREIQDQGVQVHAEDVGFIDVSDFMKALEMLLRARIAKDESRNIGERTARGKRARAQSGKVIVNTTAKYGYDYVRETGTLAKNKAESEIVEKIYHWYVVGDETGRRLGSYVIARKLTEMGVPTKHDTTGYRKPKRGYGVWGRSAVMRILRDETYCGVWYYNRTAKGRTRTTRYKKPREQWIGVAVPAIVSRELWEAAQRQAPENAYNSPRNVKHDYLLRGRLTCSTCGYLMRCKFDKRAPARPSRYWCHGQTATYSADGKTPTCHSALDQQMVDTLVWEHIAQQLKHPERIIKAFQQKQAEKEAEQAPDRRYLERCQAELKKTQASLKRIIGLYAEGRFDMAMLDEESTPKQRKIKELEDKIAELERRLADTEPIDETSTEAFLRFCEQIGAGLENMTFELKRQVIELLQIEVLLHRGQVDLDIAKRDRGGRFIRHAHMMTGASITVSGLIPLMNIPLAFEAQPALKPHRKSVRFSLLIKLPDNNHSQH